MTKQEKTILDSMHSRGIPASSIAARLGISVNTVQSHLRRHPPVACKTGNCRQCGRSISENVTWGQRKRLADGKVTMPYKHFLGYRKSADGVPEIVLEEAVTVRKIYRLAAQGHSTGFIAKILTADGDLTPTGMH